MIFELAQAMCICYKGHVRRAMHLRRSSLGSSSLIVRLSVILLMASMLYSERIFGKDNRAPFYKWQHGDNVSEAQDRDTLDIQVQALESADPSVLKQLGHQPFAKVVEAITADSIVTLKALNAKFTPDAAAAFGIVIQSGSQQLLQDHRDNEDNVKVTGIKAQGIVFWMVSVGNVAIAVDTVARALNSFCPMYPFCK
jgi:hypothetical protein